MDDEVSEVAVFSNASAKDGCEEELRSLLLDLVETSKSEPGVLSFKLHENIKKPGKFYLFELYKDQASADAHMKSSHMAKAMTKARAFVQGMPMMIQTKMIAD
jgi:quinol monooxygenase YgiN